VSIDGQGRQVRQEWGSGPALGSAKPVERYRESLAPPSDPIPLPVFGLIRADVLRKTRLMAGYPDCDRALLAELSLYGRFYEIPQALFFHREHKNRAGPHLSRDPYWALAFWNPKTTGQIVYPHWWLFAGHMSAIARSPRYLLSSWFKRLHQATKDIDSLIPVEATIILVDDAAFGTEAFAGRRTRPFVEREGAYWGPPPDGGTAIQELERMRHSGASYLVVAWPAFWWLDYYIRFHDYLRTRFRCVLENDRLVVFDLRT
jgi:hypothetical protein